MSIPTKFGSCIHHALLFTLVLTVTITIRSALKERYRQDRRVIERIAASNRIQELMARWNALAYQRDFSTLLVNAAIAGLEKRGITFSGGPQLTALKSRLKKVFDYLQNPAIDAYLDIRTSGLEYAFQPTAITRQRFANATVGKHGGLRGVLEALWAESYGQEDGRPRIVEVCVDSLLIATSHTNSAASILLGDVSQEFTVAQEAMNPGFSYVSVGQNRTDEPVTNVFLHLSFSARSSRSTDAAPVYISLVWCPRDQNWALSQMFADRLLKLNFFF